MDDTSQPRGSILKFSYLRQLRLQPGEVEAASAILSASDSQTSVAVPSDILRQFEGLPMSSQLPARLPSPNLPSPSAALVAFGKAVVDLRKQNLAALKNQPTTTAAVGRADKLSGSIGAAANLLNSASI